MKKRLLAMIMTLAMCLSLLPTAAFASGNAGTGEPTRVVNGAYDAQGNWVKNGTVDPNDNFVLSKTATPDPEDPNKYTITLQVDAIQTTETVTDFAAAATVLVMDLSLSMRYCADCGADLEGRPVNHEDNCAGKNNPQNRLTVAKAAAIDFLKSYGDITDENGVVTANSPNATRFMSIVRFGTRATLHRDWVNVATVDGYRQAKASINNMELPNAMGGNTYTNLDAGLTMANEQLGKSAISSVSKSNRNVVLLSDGAPTTYGDGSDKDYQNGKPKYVQAAADEAKSLQEKATVYTICFGAANDLCYTGNNNSYPGYNPGGSGGAEDEETEDIPTVGEFLRDSIATPAKTNADGTVTQYAYNADDSAKLKSEFEKITNNVVNGINGAGATVTDPMGSMITLDKSSVNDDYISGETITWTLSDPDKETTANNVKTSTYTLSYDITVDYTQDGFVEGEYYPANGRTTLSIPATGGGAPTVLDFPVPGVTGVLPEYTVTWVDEDETVLETDENVPYGTDPSYDGGTPTKAATAEYTYTFAGWTPVVSAVTGDVTYTATYTSTPREYTVTYKLDGVQQGEVENVAYGTEVTVRDQAEKTGYTVSPWTSGDVIFVNNKFTMPAMDVVIEATSSVKTYTVTWVNYDGTVLETDEKVPYGTTPTFNGTNPTKAPDAQYTYYFDGWTPALEPVTEDVTYTAKYRSELNKYTVTWVDGNGETLKTEQVAYGETPAYTGETPTKTATAQYTYTFNNTWSPGIVAVTEDAEYTAQFDSTVNKYTVTFKDEDGSILKAATEYDYNTAAADIVKPADPTKEADDTYFYTFAGWDSTIVDVTDDAVYIATYTPTEIDSDFAIIKEVISVSSDIVAYTDDEGIPESIPTAKVGDTITWKITLVNQGNVAQTFTLSDILTYEGSETAITGVTVTADEGSPAITEGQVTLEAAGEDGFTTATYTATYVVGVNDAGKTLINTAVAGNGRDDDEKDPADGVKVEYPLELSKTVDKTDAKVGNTITYTITVKNTGNKDLSDVVITDTFNGNGTLSFTNTDNVTFADGKFTIKTLAVGKPETITVKYVAASGDANKTVTNTVASELDGNKDDDSVSTKITKKNKPSTPIPDTPPALNNTDHFAYIIGYPDGTVKPAGNITRAEVATIFFRLLTDDARDLFWATENEYSDVAANQWFNNAISTLSNAGIINGYEDGTFRPNAPITRAEFAKIAASFFNYAEAEYQGLFSDVPANKWYALYVEAASDLGLVTGYPDGTFLPEKSITRAEACTIVNRTIERNPHEDQLHEDMIVWVDNPAPGEDGHEWYYEQVQEATNSHDYELVNEYENWVEILENRDWAALEQAWSDSNSAPGGEVM